MTKMENGNTYHRHRKQFHFGGGGGGGGGGRMLYTLICAACINKGEYLS